MIVTVGDGEALEEHATNPTEATQIAEAIIILFIINLSLVVQ